MWNAIWAFLLATAVPLAVKVLGGLGLTFVAYTGVDYGLSYIKTDLINSMSGIDIDLLQILYLMRLDQGISILFAAMALRLYIRFTLRAASTVVWRAPGTRPNTLPA